VRALYHLMEDAATARFRERRCGSDPSRRLPVRRPAVSRSLFLTVVRRRWSTCAVKSGHSVSTPADSRRRAISSCGCRVETCPDFLTLPAYDILTGGL